MRIQSLTDSATLIHIHRSELVQLETLRFHFADSVKMVTRSVTVRERQADTAAATSSMLRSDTVASSTQTTTTNPLTVQSKKKGRTPLCANWLIVVLIIFVVFVVWWLLVKKKKYLCTANSLKYQPKILQK